jgi:hypothetical protein
MDGETISFQIQSSFDFNVRVSTVIRICLGLSLSKLNLLLVSDTVYFNGKPLQKKFKIKNGDTVTIKKQALIDLYLIGKEELFLKAVNDK